MRLIANPLQQVKPFGVAGENHRVRLCRNPNLLQALGESDHRNVADAEFVEHPLSGIDLGGTAVHDVEVGRIGEPSGLLGENLFCGIASPALCDVARETAPGDFRNRGDIVGPAAAGCFPDGEVPIVGLTRQAILEHHQRADHIGALHMTDIHALDPQRSIGQPQRLLNVLQRSRSRGEVAGPF